MDGYLSKPIDVDQLISAVEQYGGRSSPEAIAARGGSSATAIFDEHAALACTGGDRRLLRQVVAMFQSDAPSNLRRIERAIGARDAEALRMAAHALKGAIATVGSNAGRQAAAALEQLAKRWQPGRRAFRVRRPSRTSSPSTGRRSSGPDSWRHHERANAGPPPESRSDHDPDPCRGRRSDDPPRDARGAEERGLFGVRREGWRRGAQSAAQPALRSDAARRVDAAHERPPAAGRAARASSRRRASSS